MSNNKKIKPKLIIITESYPFRGGDDTFLPREADYLNDHWECKFVPTDVRGEIYFKLPVGSTVDTSLTDLLNAKRKSISYKVKVLLSVRFLMELILSLPRSIYPRAIQEIFSWAFESAVATIWQTNTFQQRGEKQPDVIYSWWSAPVACGVAKVCTQKNVPFVSRMHGYDLFGERHITGKVPFQKSLVKHATKIFSVSQAGLEYLESLYPNRKSKFRVSRLEINFHEDKSLASNDGTFRIVSCSYAVPVKRVPLLARSLMRLAEKYPTVNIHWTHIGDGPELPAVKEIVESPSRPNLNVDLPGHIEQKEVYNFYRTNRVDLAISVSASEGGGPLSLVEAASFGIPLMATLVGGSKELISQCFGIGLSANPTASEIASAIFSSIHESESIKSKRRQTSYSATRSLYGKGSNYAGFSEELKKLLRIISHQVNLNCDN